MPLITNVVYPKRSQHTTRVLGRIHNKIPWLAPHPDSRNAIAALRLKLSWCMMWSFVSGGGWLGPLSAHQFLQGFLESSCSYNNGEYSRAGLSVNPELKCVLMHVNSHGNRPRVSRVSCCQNTGASM